ncbi:hypothetical protein MtrunA17_Chr6g0462741 [Medicago truncatula]|uniref:Transmembrane protein n=1 Tax=Medicago truncatula TaxID=3880 RepID=A0A396HI41_MEDTR|nr:hypothetical protein MtrunA17_Chr6g0462741 [Medicago truncatula]
MHILMMLLENYMVLSTRVEYAVWVWGFVQLLLLESVGISQILFKLVALMKRMLKTYKSK